MSKYIVAAAALAAAASGKVFFHEDFANRDAWVDSTTRDDFGKLVISSGDFYGDKAINQGLKTSQDARFYSSSVKLTEPVTNEGKDFVVSLSVKHEQGLDCGGGYIKLLPTFDQKKFNGDSEYFLMFGPDQCGSSRRVHAIINYKGENHLWKKEPRYPDDKLTHVYTLRITPENKYEMYIDQELKESGSLEEDWKLLPAQKIDDPEDKKPADWIDQAEIDDPEDKKPEDWDTEPEQIADPEAKKPEDWDDVEDGEWETPMVPNPKHKGDWRARRIPNPAYKGQWSPKQIANPKYEADDKLYMIRKPIEYVGIDIWQVKSGSIFDNIIIGDNLEEVNAIVDSTWKATKDAEKKAQEATETKDAPAEEAKDEDL
eukprot:GILJ01012396.1.p1 GENE.GILJ01012396.1~~GILJ01012396.1.p1  ORF type:complete len:372 (+),score=101.59 GILJ01012396.1:29-1144(+)